MAVTVTALLVWVVLLELNIGRTNDLRCLLFGHCAFNINETEEEETMETEKSSTHYKEKLRRKSKIRVISEILKFKLSLLYQSFEPPTMFFKLPTLGFYLILF